MSRPLRADAERNRRRLLEAAAELFARKGLGVGLDEIAHHAGVGVGTAYRRFANKDELIEALFEDRLEQIPALAERAARREDAFAGLVEYLEGAVRLQSNDQGLKELFFGSAHAVERVAEARERILPAVEDMLARAQAAGQLRRDVKQTDVALIQFMLTGLSDITLQADPEVWRRYLAIVLDGLRAEAPAELPVPALSGEALYDVVRRLPKGAPNGTSH